MTRATTSLRRRLPVWTFIAALCLGAVATFDEGPISLGQAHAIIGRPLTPMSYAGVARRTTRRAVGVGVGVGVGATAVATAATIAVPKP